MSEDYTQAEIVRTLKRIEEKVDTLSANYLPRTEWNLWAETRDREIKELKAARAPWWTWVSVLCTVGALGLSLLPKILS